MKPTKGYIFIDIDGTLVDTSLTLNQVDVDSIVSVMELGYDVILTSGRPLKFVEWIRDQIHENVKVIGFNGAMVETEVLKTLPKTTIHELMHLEETVIFKNENGYFSNKKQIPQVFEYEMLDDYSQSKTPISNILKVIVWVGDQDFLKVQKQLELIKGITLMSYYPKGFEIMPHGIDKGVAIKHYVDKKLPIYSIGNDVNDIPMFQVSDAYYVVGDKLEGQQVKNVSEAIHKIIGGI